MAAYDWWSDVYGSGPSSPEALDAAAGKRVGNSDIASAYQARKALDVFRNAANRPQQGPSAGNGQITRGGSQMPQQASGMAQQMGDLIKDPANIGGQMAGATGAIGATLNANADRQNELANTQATEEGKTRRLSMLMGLMGPLLGGGGGGGYGGGGFMTNFGQAAIPSSMFGGIGGGGSGGLPMLQGGGGIDYNAAQQQQDFMRQNMMKTLAGMRSAMSVDPSKVNTQTLQF